MAGVIDTLTAAAPRAGNEGGTFGVAVGQVIDNIDSLSLGRVQLSLPWLPDFEPWARVAVLSAGSGRGTWFIPQVGDEVLVAFEHGDVRQPYVIGSLWNGSDSPPADSPTDSVGRRIIKTPAGHEIELDDVKQSITITSSSEQTVTITPDTIELSAGNDAAKITLETAGTITLKAAVKIELQAPEVKISGTNVELSGDAAATLKGGATCTVQGGVVRIN
jgi:phage baseplate assembly protein V